MVKSPNISSRMEKKYSGYNVLSLDGKILGIGKNPLLALEEAKKKMPNIDKKEFLISKIHGKEPLIA